MGLDLSRRAVLTVALLSAAGCARQSTQTPPPAPVPTVLVEPVVAPPVAAPPTRDTTTVAVTPPPAASTPVVTRDTTRIPLPPIPSVTGQPLNISVIYPPRDQMISSRDSNFILGSVGSGDATLEINGAPVVVKPNGAYLAWLPIPEGRSPAYIFVARRGADSATLVHPVRTWRSPTPPVRPCCARPETPPPPGLVSLGKFASDSDRTVVIRPVPSGTYKWFAVPGTRVERVSAENGWTRIRLDSSLDAYVASSDVAEIDSAKPAPPRRLIGNLVVAPDSAWTDVIFPLRDAPPYLVEEEADKLVLTLYSTRATTDIISFRTGDSVIRTITWEPLTTDRVRYVVHLREAPYGYLAFHDGQRFVLRVRRAPRIDATQPLKGLTIAVDAGHPPIGSTGPTGLYEGVATLGIAKALEEELQQRGATVLMTRTTPDAVELASRPIMARRANAHALVSIHLNAVPDGVNPERTNGTGTYFFHPHSEPLARAAQAGMVRSMGLPDLGVYYDNLALVRPTWMPAILCEGAFLIVPEQEAAMRDPAGQKAYALGVADGIEKYFKERSAKQ